MRGRAVATEKAKDFKGTLKKLIKSLGNYKIPMIIIFVFAILSTVFSIISPKILGNATTEIFNGLIAKITGTGGIDFGKIAGILITLLVLYLLSLLFSFIQGIIMTNISQRYAYKLRKQVSIKMHKVPISYYDKKTHGEVLSLLTNDIDLLGQNLNQSATQFITSIVTLLGILVMMLSINVTITILVVIVLPIAAFITSKIVKRSQKYFIRQQNYLAKVNGDVEEAYGGHQVIKAFNAEDKMLNMFQEDSKKLADSAWKSQFLSGLMHPLMVFLGNINYVVVAIVGGYFAINGVITVGNIQSFISYSKNFTNPISQLAQISTMLQQAMAAAERVFEFLDEEEEIDAKESLITYDKVKGAVSFEHVSFGYDKDKIIIHDFNCQVKPGQKIAIVGPTGAGKTTIVKLLMRFYHLNSGKIKVDGVDLENIKKEDINKIFGMVLQDAWLYSGKIIDNIRYGKLDATDEEVKEACSLARVDHFITTLPDGYNMEINEESSNISLGQKQLLTIARVILANPKILILDEATSSVDTRTEVLIQEAMDHLMQGRTSFIIAHRLSTIKNADLILVLNDGDVVEQGTHEELLKKDGFYAKLYNSQFESVN